MGRMFMHSTVNTQHSSTLLPRSYQLKAKDTSDELQPPLAAEVTKKHDHNNDTHLTRLPLAEVTKEHDHSNGMYKNGYYYGNPNGTPIHHTRLYAKMFYDTNT